MLKNLDRISGNPGMFVEVRDLLGHHVCPESRIGRSVSEHLVRNRGQVVNQSQVGPR
jgi:hypothetical protein